MSFILCTNVFILPRRRRYHEMTQGPQAKKNKTATLQQHTNAQTGPNTPQPKHAELNIQDGMFHVPVVSEQPGMQQQAHSAVNSNVEQETRYEVATFTDLNHNEVPFPQFFLTPIETPTETPQNVMKSPSLLARNRRANPQNVSPPHTSDPGSNLLDPPLSLGWNDSPDMFAFHSPEGLNGDDWSQDLLNSLL